MYIRKVDDRFAVAPQVQAEDMQALADVGYTAVMCNRPDGEEPGQPPLAELKAAAEAAGLTFHHVPVSGGHFPEEALAEFARIRREADGPLLAYCRSGTRCITMETLSNPMGLSVDERISRAAEAGYDLSSLRGHLS
ncbi:TIGR01244 family sulfur transferase [Aurantiacibacter sp. MUD61]|uniref:TIGR01244 family sulfur transferase n=1 Tax=Aurantiacibacter sp. MUD61 TaxID=3009083 RepID=UPI0022F001FD|nr:TIGR01244 family sulfur transferase [Aurantiacibacter sp. MUD61]